MKVLIVGAGIAGLSLAKYLENDGSAAVTLVERSPDFHTIGFIIYMWANGIHLIEKMGISREIINRIGYGVSLNTIKGWHGTQKDFPLGFSNRFASLITMMRRSDLHSILAASLKETRVRFNTTISSIVQSPSDVHVRFSDGSEDSYDLVVGADGVHSSVRRHVFKREFAVPYNWKVWIYWLAKDFPRPDHPVGVMGDGKICAIIPHLDSCAAMLVTSGNGAKIGASVSFKEQLEVIFKDFDPLTKSIVSVATNDEDMFVDEIFRVDMPTWYRGRTVLIGDAQHALSPITGAGASVAIEDAFVLARELQSAHGDVDAALERFSKLRTPRVRKFQTVVSFLDRWLMAGGLTGRIRDIVFPLIPASYFMNSLKKFVEEEI